MAGFIDSNVLLFLITTEKAKADKAMELLADGGVVSVEVLDEIVQAARESGIDWHRASDFADVVATLGKVQPMTLETHKAARTLGAADNLSMRDALMLASALEAGCATIHSAVIPPGPKAGGRLMVIDPFA